MAEKVIDSDSVISSPDALYKNTLLNFLWIDNTINQDLPIDYGVLFTGMEYRFNEIESTRECIKNNKARLDSFITNTIWSLSIKEEDKTRLLRLVGIEEGILAHRVTENTNFKILEWFDYLFKNSYNANAADMFIDMIKKVGLSSFSYQKENKLLFAIQYLFYKYRQFEDEEIGIIPFNTGKIGGSLFFVVKNGKSQTTLQKVLDQLHSDGNLISLDYASWRDGYSSNGVRVEQYITERLYSDYTKEGSVLFMDSFGASYSSDYEAIIESEKDCILLDTIQGRVYIKGMRLTSKDIHSQNTTIDMLKILLENIGKEVPNTYLPVSTYSQNKNEILGKVVLPIRKLAKEHFWQELSLVCSWWITDYYLRLEKDDIIRIGIIKKLQN